MSCYPSATACPPPARVGSRAALRTWSWTGVTLLVGGLHVAALVALLPVAQELPDDKEPAGLLMVTVAAADLRPQASVSSITRPPPRQVPATDGAPTASPALAEADPVTAVQPASADDPPAPRPAMAEPLAAAAPAPAVPSRPAENAAARTGVGQTATATYFGQLTGWLNRHKRYPTAAKKAKEQGVVVVSFTIDRRGELVASAIEKSSGHHLLDAAALALLQRAAPMPRIPDAMGLQTLTVSLPIDYSLITH